VSYHRRGPIPEGTYSHAKCIETHHPEPSFELHNECRMRSVVVRTGGGTPPRPVPEARIRHNPPAKDRGEPVGSVLRRVRERYGLTPHDVSRDSGYAVAFIGRVETTLTAPSEVVVYRLLRTILTATTASAS